MYARGMSQRDISATIDDIYGFKLSESKYQKSLRIGRATKLAESDACAVLSVPFCRLPVRTDKTRLRDKRIAVYNILGIRVDEPRKFWVFGYKTARANTLGCRY